MIIYDKCIYFSLFIYFLFMLLYLGGKSGWRIAIYFLLNHNIQEQTEFLIADLKSYLGNVHINIYNIEI